MGAPHEGGTTCRAMNEMNARRLTAGPMLASSAHHGRETVGGEVHALPHVNLDAHPGMNATLEQVFSIRETEESRWLPWRIRVFATATVEKPLAHSGTTFFAGPFSPGTNLSTELLLLSIRQLTNSHLIIPVIYEFG